MNNRFEGSVRLVEEDAVRSVRSATKRVAAARVETLNDVFEDLDAARLQASAIKSFVLDNLKSLILQLEENCTRNGIKVHWAKDAASANDVIRKICDKAAPHGAKIVKAKSMATEEIHLNASL